MDLKIAFQLSKTHHFLSAISFILTGNRPLLTVFHNAKSNATSQHTDTILYIPLRSRKTLMDTMRSIITWPHEQSNPWSWRYRILFRIQRFPILALQTQPLSKVRLCGKGVKRTSLHNAGFTVFVLSLPVRSIASCQHSNLSMYRAGRLGV